METLAMQQFENQHPTRKTRLQSSNPDDSSEPVRKPLNFEPLLPLEEPTQSHHQFSTWLLNQQSTRVWRYLHRQKVTLNQITLLCWGLSPYLALFRHSLELPSGEIFPNEANLNLKLAGKSH